MKRSRSRSRSRSRRGNSRSRSRRIRGGKKTNRLAMVSKQKSKGRKNKGTKGTKGKGTKGKGIVDVPLAKKLSEGSKASLGSIDYHYQKYYNTFAFIEELLHKNP